MSEIPVIEFDVNPGESVPSPVDDTLSNAGEAADAKAVGDALADLKTELEGEISTASGTLSDAIAALFPVGAVYVSTSATAPQFFGSWAEILIPATWGNLNTGARDYATLSAGDTPGTLHFWMRTA